MSCPLQIISRLNRPKILVAAARHGAGHYDRRRHLRRLLGDHHSSNTSAVLWALIDREEGWNAKRLSGEGPYSLHRHIDVLSALISEYESALRALRVP